MRNVLVGAVPALLLAAASAPAQATYMFDFDDVVTVAANDVGMKFTVDYAGKANGSYTSNLSAIGTYTFTGVSNGGKTYNFNYSLTNDSNYDSRIRAFGFDTSVSPTAVNGASGFTYAYQNASFVEGISSLDVCLAAGAGCTQHASGGIDDGATLNGSFTLTFANIMQSVDFDHFAMKFLGVNPKVNGQDWGAGLGAITSVTHGQPPIVSTAPEPATWAMMLGGFGLIGWVLRQRRRHDPIIARQLI